MDDTTIINDLYTKILALSDAGDEAAAKKLLAEEFTKLSEQAQGALLTRMYVDSLQQEIAQADAIAQVQEAALNALREIEGQQEKEGDSAQPGA